MNKLMVLESAWHYRKATYWDMPKCATCEHLVTMDTGQIHAVKKCKNHQAMSVMMVYDEGFGCVHHSEIEQPTKEKEE